MTTASEPSKSSSVTLGELTQRKPYERKVRLTITRREADIFRAAMMRLATHPDWANELRHHGSRTVIRRAAQRLWNKAEKAIEKRDTAMRIKGYQTDDSDILIRLPGDQA